MSLQNNILQTIHHLRTSGHFVLYTNQPKVTEGELEDVGEFLAQEYENESLNYPYKAPKFDTKAAVWAAKTIYYAAQFLVHRLEKPQDLENFFQPFQEKSTVEAQLSADISLRFLPQIINELELIDYDDWLITILKNILTDFPYASIGHDLELKFDTALLANQFTNDCFRTLFTDRVIAQKDLQLTHHTIIHKNVAIHLGEHAKQFWSAFVTEETSFK